MPPSQLFPGAITWRGINTENSVISGSNLKGYKPPFWISVNLSDTFKTQMKQDKQSFCVTISRREENWTEQIISYRCIWSLFIWVLIKILMTLFRFLRNSSPRSCFKGSLMPITWSHIMLQPLKNKTKIKVP